MAKITTTSNAALDLEPDGTGDINLTPGTNGDVNIPANKGITFGDDAEKIEGDGTDLTVSSSNDLNLTATTDINIPQNVGLTFGDDGEKIEGDGTDLTVSSSGNFTVDATGDIILDADDADVTLKDGGTTYGSLKQASGHLVIQPTTSKQIILNDEGGSAALTIGTSGDTTLAGTANNIGTATGTFNGTIGSSASFTDKVYAQLNNCSTTYGDMSFGTVTGDTTNITVSGANVTLVKGGIYLISCCFNWRNDGSERYCWGHITSVSGTYSTSIIATCNDEVAYVDSDTSYGGATATYVGTFAANDVIKFNYVSGDEADVTNRADSHASIIRIFN